ncbi:MAG: hypothetical protein ACK5LC_15225 [Coprobacillaceae bacterium]
MIEKKILNNSITIFIVGFILLTVIAVITSLYTLLSGFLLGYMIGVLAFIITVKFTDMVLLMQDTTARLSSVMFLIKMAIYATGIILAIKLPDIFHIITVVIGYLIIKVTIYITAYKNKGGEWSA